MTLLSIFHPVANADCSESPFGPLSEADHCFSRHLLMRSGTPVNNPSHLHAADVVVRRWDSNPKFYAVSMNTAGQACVLAFHGMALPRNTRGNNVNSDFIANFVKPLEKTVQQQARNDCFAEVHSVDIGSEVIDYAIVDYLTQSNSDGVFDAQIWSSKLPKNHELKGIGYLEHAKPHLVGVSRFGEAPFADLAAKLESVETVLAVADTGYVYRKAPNHHEVVYRGGASGFRTFRVCTIEELRQRPNSHRGALSELISFDAKDVALSVLDSELVSYSINFEPKAYGLCEES